VLLLSTLGAEVTLVAPPTLLPVGVDQWSCSISYDLDAVLPKSDVVMMLRVQRERMPAGVEGRARGGRPDNQPATGGRTRRARTTPASATASVTR
jgi:aspartate carbamoyltransferase catalytic subunit